MIRFSSNTGATAIPVYSISSKAGYMKCLALIKIRLLKEGLNGIVSFTANSSFFFPLRLTDLLKN